MEKFLLPGILKEKTETLEKKAIISRALIIANGFQ